MRIISPKRLTSPWGWAVLFAVLFLTANIALVLFIRDDHARMVALDITSPLAGLLASGALYAASSRSKVQSRKLSLAWRVFFVAQLSFALGDVLWGILEAGLGQEAFPSIADYFYLAYYPLFLAGIFLLPTQRLSSREWFKRIIDMVTVMAAAGVGFWNFLIGPLAVEHVSDPLLTQVLSLAYPVGDLILLWGLLFLIYRRLQAQHSGPLMFLALSVTAMILTDCVFGYQSLVGTYVSGGLVDMGWIAAYLFSGLAGVMQALRVQPVGEIVQEARPRSQVALNNWGIYLPYAGLLGAYLLLLVSHSLPLPMHFAGLSLAVAGIILLVLVRQVLSLHEIRSQAAELETTNLELAGEIEQRQRVEAQLSHDALHDALTDLPNRALFSDRLGRAIEYSRRNYHSFSMLFLDLDHFKVVNDSLGHPVGDQLLISIGQRLKACLRSSDTIARFGGDEFVILIESTGEEAVTAVADRIQEELKLPFYLGDHKVYVSASIGIIQSMEEYDRPEDILRDADIAMYQAKAMGKSRSEVFDTHLRRKAVLRLQIENELRRALENNEFELYYQPIQALQSSHLVGFEALIRWNHPSRGLLLPAEFMQVAEESGIILPIGRWVLHEACAQTKAWQDRYPSEPPITININISGRQFAQPNFVGQVEEVLQETGLNPASLKLEITESVLIDNPIVAGQAFSRLNDLGVQLQVDDFGTGYSALSYLQRFPIQTIKIDRTFIEEMSSAGKQSGLVQTIIFMARDLGMEATAEGIETEQQLQTLQQLGCSYGQGFLFSRPMDSARVSDWFERTMSCASGAAQPEGETAEMGMPHSDPPALIPLPGAA